MSSNIKVVELSRGQGFGLEDNYTQEQLNNKKKYAIRVSENIDYVISFWIKQSSLAASLELKLKSFNENFSYLISKSILTDESENCFIKSSERIVSTTNRYYFVKYILYNSSQNLNTNQPLTSLAVGRNLIMKSGTKNIFINLLCTDNTIKIWNFKVRPLRLPFGTGFLGINNLLYIWRKNNKNYKTDDEIDNLAKDYLLPYNSIQAVINL